MSEADANLTLIILRDIQDRLAKMVTLDRFEKLEARVDKIDNKLEIVSERLSLLEKSQNMVLAHFNVGTRKSKKHEADQDEAIEELRERVSRLEELVKP